MYTYIYKTKQSLSVLENVFPGILMHICSNQTWKKRTLLYLWRHRLLCPRIFLANLIHQCDQASSLFTNLCLEEHKMNHNKEKMQNVHSGIEQWFKILLPSGKSDPSWRLLSGDEAVEKWALKKSNINACLILENSWPLSCWFVSWANQPGTMECWTGFVWCFFYFQWGFVCVCLLPMW